MSSDDDEDDEEYQPAGSQGSENDYEELDGGASQMSDGTVCNDAFDDPEGFCKEDDPMGVDGMDLDNDADKAEGKEQKGQKRKADQLREMADQAGDLKVAKTKLQKLRKAFDTFQAAVKEYDDEFEDMSDEQREKKQEELANLQDALNMAEDAVQNKEETQFAKMQKEAALIVANEVKRFENQGRGFGVVKTAIENRVKAELKKKYNTDPAKEEALNTKVEDINFMAFNKGIGAWIRP